MDGRFGGPLGGKHAGGGHGQFHGSDAVPGRTEPARGRTAHAHRRRHAPLSIHGGRSGDVDEAVVGRSAHHENQRAALRVRVQSTVESASVSKSSLWAGRIVSGLVVLFLIFDGVTKAIKVPKVVEATVQAGFPESTIVGIGVALLVSTALYMIPRTVVLGAILLTGYLGGATAVNVRLGNGAFITSFPVIFGILVWLGLYLRESRLRALIPLRS